MSIQINIIRAIKQAKLDDNKEGQSFPAYKPWLTVITGKKNCLKEAISDPGHLEKSDKLRLSADLE
jgi:hypothetical protein